MVCSDFTTKTCVSTQKCLTEEYSIQLFFLLPSQLLAKYMYAKNQQQFS